jgi:GT2 family glycosyltransferase/spore maturation protein CgeB
LKLSYGSESVTISLEDLLDGSDFDPGSHALATDILDYVSPGRIYALLEALDAITDHDGVAVVSGFITDSPKVPLTRNWPGAAIVSRRDRAPYTHHRSELEAALVNTSWLLGGIELDSDRRSRVLLVKSERRRGPHAAEGHELRSRWPDLESGLQQSRDRVAELSSRIADLQRAVAAKEQATRDLQRQLEQAQASLAAESAAAAEHAADIQARATERESELTATLGELERQTAELADARDDAVRRLGQANERAAKATQSAQERKKKLDKATRQLERLRNRRTVRLALAVASLGRPIFRAVRRIRTGKPASSAAKTRRPVLPVAAKRSIPTTTAALTSAMRKQRSGVGVSTGPLVSIVVVTRDGYRHLNRLLPALRDRTAYQNIELIVVDNGSTDDTHELLKTDWGFPLRVIDNDHNTSFSVGNNQGLAVATGELILLLNNDVDPINTEWLGAMVETLTSHEDCGAVGALLVYPEFDGDEPPPHVIQLGIQHSGIRFTWRDGVPRAVNLGRGDDPTDPQLADIIAVPAATAACLLLRTDTLRQIGGLNEDYVYGTEDVDLGLKLKSAGLNVVVDGRAALFHHEFGTQDVMANEVKRINRMGNLQTFAESWSPRLARTLLLDLFEPDRKWLVNERPIVAITLTRDDPASGWGDWYTAHELGDAFDRLGWEVRYAARYREQWYELDDDVDLVISLLDLCDARRLPQNAYKIAWIRNWVDRWVSHEWIDDFDLVLASSDVAMDIVAEKTGHSPHKVPLATNPDRFSPQPDDPTYISDYAFTGNSWGASRELVDLLEVRPGERYLLFGKGWDEQPRWSRYWRGHLPYDQLPALYSNTKIVLDDTAGPTKPYGAVNSRVFDALAAGTLVLTDNVIGARELFGDLLPTYSSREELRSQLDKYLGDDDLREKTASRLQAQVRQNHTYDIVAQKILEVAQEHLMRPKVAIKIGPPNHEEAEAWGDTHFARALAGGLRNLGYQTDIQILPEWDAPDRQDADLVVHLRGLVPYVPRAAQVNVLWVISHPDDVSPGECDQFDLVLVASETAADRLRSQTSVPVHTMHQATDTERFQTTDADPELATELLFVGNSRKKERIAVKWSIEAGLPLTVYGADWEGIIDQTYVKDSYFPNERLNEAYVSADIVLNDHWPDMRAEGIVSNRIFDALACGAFVISDDVAGIDELFAGAVPTFTSREELHKLVDHYLKNPAGRKLLSKRGQDIVRESHSFAARAAQIDELAKPLLAGRKLTVAAD